MSERTPRLLPARGRSSFSAVAGCRGEPLRSPVSGAPCVYWRLRIAEQVNGSLQLVHEITSTEDFELTAAPGAAWAPPDQAGAGEDAALAVRPALRLRVAAPAAHIEAVPVLHRAGSPGAAAVARLFGLQGQLSVEEVTLAAGAEIAAEGFIDGAADPSAGPFRGVEREIELVAATVRLPGRAVLGPALLPWALGTAAALLGGAGAATWAAMHFDLLPRFRHGVFVPRAEIRPDRPMRRHFSVPE